MPTLRRDSDKVESAKYYRKLGFIPQPNLRKELESIGDVMMSQTGLGIKDLLQEQRGQILEIAQKHGAYNVRVFGSVARGEAKIANLGARHCLAPRGCD